MGKLRHVALAVPDPWKAAEFYMRAFGLAWVGDTRAEFVDGVYLSDGVINLALLHYKTSQMAGEDRGPEFVGIHHIGFWVDDPHAARRQVEAAGAKYWMGEVPEAGDIFYELKFRDPLGIVFDVSAHGWGGASKDGTTTVQAAAEPTPERIAK